MKPEQTNEIKFSRRFSIEAMEKVIKNVRSIMYIYILQKTILI